MKNKQLHSKTIYHILSKTARFCAYAACLLLANAMIAQPKFSSQKEIIAAEAKLKALSPDTAKVSQLLKLSDWYSNTNSKGKAILYAKEALRLSKQLDHAKGIASCDLEFAKIEQNRNHYENASLFAKKAVSGFLALKEYNLLGESYVMVWSTATLLNKPIETRIEMLKKASDAFSISGNKFRSADCLKELGDLYQMNDRTGEALVVLKEAEAKYKSCKNAKLYGVYDLLNTVSMDLGDYRRAIIYGLSAVKDAEKFGEKGLSLCTIYNRLSESYCPIHEWENALDCIEKSFSIAEKHKDAQSIYITFCNKTFLLLILKRNLEAKEFLLHTLQKYPEIAQMDRQAAIPSFFFEIYNRLGEKQPAAFYEQKLIEELNKPEQGISAKIKISILIIQHYIKEKKLEKASYYSKNYTEIVEHHNVNKEATALSHLWRFKIDSIRKDYPSAIKSYQLYKKEMDAIAIEETKREVNQFNIIYETEKKDKNILQLKKKEHQQQANLVYESKMRTIILILLALVIIILVLAIMAFYEKQKSNHLLKKKQDEINVTNRSLQHLVTEKEWLLREIHHRVKNNLHMVVGLLASQTEFIKDKEALKVISDSQHRVQAMSIIHQKLYQTETLSHIDMADYIFELTEYLKNSFNEHHHIRFELDVEPLTFPLSYSVPIGLIINEALTNSIKYAFPKTDDCIITISLKSTGGNRFLLKITDNGIGIPEDFDVENSDSLGMRLIFGLSHDIHATLELSNENGTAIAISFEMIDNELQTIAS